MLYTHNSTQQCPHQSATGCVALLASASTPRKQSQSQLACHFLRCLGVRSWACPGRAVLPAPRLGFFGQRSAMVLPKRLAANACKSSSLRNACKSSSWLHLAHAAHSVAHSRGHRSRDHWRKQRANVIWYLSQCPAKSDFFMQPLCSTWKVLR